MQVILFISVLTFSCSQEKKSGSESAEKENIERKVESEKKEMILDQENEDVKVLRYYSVNELAGYIDTCTTLGLYSLDGILKDGDTIIYEDVDSRFYGQVSKLCLGYVNYNRNKEKNKRKQKRKKYIKKYSERNRRKNSCD